MHARSALFDLYGDYLRPRGGVAPVAALVRLLAPIGIAAPAVRTAVSRMVQQGWLQPARVANGPGYAITPKAARRLDETAVRVYRTEPAKWDGHFDLIVLELPAGRAERNRLSGDLTFLGYATIGSGTWVAARHNDEVDDLLKDAGVSCERFHASHAGDSAGASALVQRAWDLGAVAEAYRRFVRDLRPVVTAVGPDSSDEQAYTARFALVHAWRAFLFRDPQLPPSLLPSRWPGTSAAEFFDAHAARLRRPADRHVDRSLELVSTPVKGGMP